MPQRPLGFRPGPLRRVNQFGVGCRLDRQDGRHIYLTLGPAVPVSINNSPGTGLGRLGTAIMQLEALRAIDSKDAPSLAPDDRPIDLVHLARTTLGDRSLEREVLQLFDRMRAATPGGTVVLAHTLKGSALGIGAWRVARAAEAVELAEGAAAAPALEALAAATDEARALIADLLKAN